MILNEFLREHYFIFQLKKKQEKKKMRFHDGIGVLAATLVLALATHGQADIAAIMGGGNLGDSVQTVGYKVSTSFHVEAAEFIVQRQNNTLGEHVNSQA